MKVYHVWIILFKRNQQQEDQEQDRVKKIGGLDYQ
jgi:hypothetical protein